MALFRSGVDDIYLSFDSPLFHLWFYSSVAFFLFHHSIEKLYNCCVCVNPLLKWTDKLHGPRYAKICHRAYEDSKDPEQPTHLSLIRAFTVR